MKYPHVVGDQLPPTDRYFEDRNPAQPAQVLGQFPIGDAEVVNLGVASARRALSDWSALSATARASILVRAAAILESRSESLAREMALEIGKPINEARSEVARCAVIFRYAAEQAWLPLGDTFNSSVAGTTILTFRRPVGIVGVITPWNFPLAIPLWKIAPALVHGNTVVLKPAEQSPLMGFRIGEILLEAQLPPGALNVVFGNGETGAALAANPDVDAISFTGSTTVGRQIAQVAHARGARVQTEMGGKNAVIVLRDSDVDSAADTILEGAFSYSGQKCSSTSRVIVEAPIHDRLVEAIASRIGSIKVGDPLDPDSQMGPLIEAEAVDRTIAYSSVAVDDGARLIVGGQRLEMPGWFVRPGLLVSVQPSSRFAQEEVFGPLIGVVKVSDEDEAVSIANLSRYGLIAGVCTNRLDAAIRLAPRLRAGMIKFNSPTSGVEPHIPFGGWADSGNYAPEQGLAARDFYTQIQAVYLAAQDSPVPGRSA